MDKKEDHHNKSFDRKQSLLVSHPDLHIKKSKIFETQDPGLRKTKIICTIG